MSWNYRVMEIDEDGMKWQAIHEVYYNAAGKPVSYTKEAIAVSLVLEEAGEPSGETLREAYDRIGEAFDKPVLKKDDFPRPDPEELRQ